MKLNGLETFLCWPAAEHQLESRVAQFWHWYCDEYTIFRALSHFNNIFLNYNCEIVRKIFFNSVLVECGAFITTSMSKLIRSWVMWAMLWYCDILTRDKNGRTFQKKLIRVSIKVCEVSQLLGDLIKYWVRHSSSQCSIQLTDYYLSDLVVTSYDSVSTALLPEDVLGLVPGRGLQVTSNASEN